MNAFSDFTLPFHFTSYKDGVSVRNDTICMFQGESGVHFGEIVLFVIKPIPVALINMFYVRKQSLIDQGGNPCRPTLIPYKEANILKQYFIPIDTERSFISDISSIIAKAVLVKTDNIKCLVVQPNNFEHH